ncbi:hypothetical protein BpHYR1_048695 [Brachionus plicatilis]|uniref:Uncharacterized protein n=1 Tax=Brachionus plicatilis TaxID=10195 RepID=A0A3M7S4P1_BRAPC|nr:hypothetical protein BpHYR1_048695 [Brachionus plicatilis]
MDTETYEHTCRSHRLDGLLCHMVRCKIDLIYRLDMFKYLIVQEKKKKLLGSNYTMEIEFAENNKIALFIKK